MKIMETKLFPKVSVLIPAYNEEKYIGTAIQYIMNQDYPNFEVIVINNASTDNTASVVQQFKDSNPKHPINLVYEGRKGTQFAREAGRMQALGEIIAMMDADCLPSKTWLTKGVQLLDYTKNVAVTGPYDYYDSSLRIRFFTLISQICFFKPMNFLVQMAKRGAIIIGGNAFIRSEVLKKCGGYNTDLSFYGDDVDIALKASAFGKVVYSNRLIMKTSSRRFKAMGFLEVQKKYNRYFFRSVFNQSTNSHDSIEIVHPR